ncbi:VRR-NUC domain-containing protein [Aeribacillus pallidus]|nr:VRR-NUC domain-containing protein [Aeribacillus pallidus]
MRETDIERHLVQEVERIGGKAPKWVSPGNRGVPDRIVILPNGRVVFVELKKPGGRMGPLQKRWAEILKGMGHQVYKIDSIKEIDRFIDKVSKEVSKTEI